MAFDGIMIAGIRKELQDTILGGRLYKVAQPEADELLLTFKTPHGQHRLVLSANASLPLVYLTEDNKSSPMTAPNFCMLLRKHLSNGRILAITQPGMERVLDFEIEHLDEMGDLCRKHLIAEFMGKYSNIIFCDDQNTIIDSIKRVPAQLSSVREVLPGRPYFIPDTAHKLNPLTVSLQEFQTIVCQQPMPLYKALYSKLTGFSPILSNEICYEASLDASRPANCLEEKEQLHLYHIFSALMEDVAQGSFHPAMYLENGQVCEFSAVKMTLYPESKPYESCSALIRDYYARKDASNRIRQKSSDLRRIVSTVLDRSYKKLELQQKQLKSTEKRDKYRIYGELLQVYGYNVPAEATQFTAENYYDNNQEITIPLDPTLTAQENAVHYFDRYNKLKRTFEADSKLIEETSAEIRHLESIATALHIAVSEEDLVEVKQELVESGYIHHRPDTRKGNGNRGGRIRKEKVTSKPFHYRSSDGFDIYVGKNNYQNDYLTFQFANGNDWWFHAKQMPGSHVIVRTNGQELPDRTFEEAASLAAYYSKGQEQDKVEVDYVLKKEVKKPAAAKPGFVVYYTNYSMMASTNITGLQLLTE